MSRLVADRPKAPSAARFIVARTRDTKEGISICAWQYIIDHPDRLSPDIARDLGIDTLTVNRYREDTGLFVPHDGVRRSRPEALVRRAKYNPQKAAELLWSHGFGDMRYKEVEAMCQEG